MTTESEKAAQDEIEADYVRVGFFLAGLFASVACIGLAAHDGYTSGPPSPERQAEIDRENQRIMERAQQDSYWVDYNVPAPYSE
jgi:hypothetical protein